MSLPPGVYLGRRRRARLLGGLRMIETLYAAGERLPSHDHARGHFCLVLEGAFEETLEGERRTLEPGHLSWQPAGLAHSERHHRAGRHFIIECDAAGEARSAAGRPLDLTESPARWIAARVHEEFADSDAASALQVESLTAELVGWTRWSLAHDARGPAPRWLELVRREIDGRFREKLALAELARVAGVHRIHLAQSFRRFFGVPPGEYQRRLRLEDAWRELRAARLGVAEIALAAGFADQSHLTRAFRRSFGMPPARFRGRVDGTARHH